MKTLYALIWRSIEPDDENENGEQSKVQAEFEARIPRLMLWLKELYKAGHLVACGGGGFEHHSGGLTIVQAENIEQAVELSKGSPMNEIGTTDIMIWDVFYAHLIHEDLVARLEA